MKRLVLFLLMFLTASIGAAEGRADRAAADYDVVVIGAGGGGLASAAALSRNGYDVLLIEQHYKLGGYMTSFERGDYTFEVSLHAMDGLDPGGMTRGTFETVGIMDKVKPIRLDPMYRIVYPEHDLEVPGDPAEYKKLLQREFPQEAEGIGELFDTMDKIEETMSSLTGMVGESSLKDRLKSSSVLLKPWVYWPVIKYWNQTLSEMLDDFIKDRELIAVFTQLSAYAGAEPDNVSALFFSVMWTSYHLGGYYYFEGGSQAVSNAMAEVIRENGGEILLQSLVTDIVVEDGEAKAVVTEDGEKYTCKWVVSNANAPDTFFKLVGREHLPSDYVNDIENMKIGLSAFVVYLGVDHDYTDVFDGMHQIMINTTYDPEESFRYVYEGVPEKTGMAIANYSTVDKTVASQGKNVIVLITMLPYDWKNGWYENESYAKYDALKQDTAEVLIKRAEKTFLPGLSSHIEKMEVGSPRTMEHYTLNPKGTIFGWDNIPEQSLMKRLPQQTPIDNLLLAGAWTFPGGGQSAVMASGVLAADEIMSGSGVK
ncbi:MAG: NAD(P)/FAD-dependent oxidoreductase [bacterium]